MGSEHDPHDDDKMYLEHPLPDENGHSTIHRFTLYISLSIVLLVILILVINNIEPDKYKEAHGLAITFIVITIIYYCQYTYIIACIQLFMERVLF